MDPVYTVQYSENNSLVFLELKKIEYLNILCELIGPHFECTKVAYNLHCKYYFYIPIKKTSMKLD